MTKKTAKTKAQEESAKPAQPPQPQSHNLFFEMNNGKPHTAPGVLWKNPYTKERFIITKLTKMVKEFNKKNVEGYQVEGIKLVKPGKY